MGTDSAASVRLQVAGETSQDKLLFGEVVAGVGDLDGDEWEDFAAISALEQVAFEQGTYEGRARVYSGRDGSLLYELENPDPQLQSPDHLFGHSLLGLDDVNADGIVDIALGSRRYDTPLLEGSSPLHTLPSGTVIWLGEDIDAGRVYVYDGASGSLLRAIDAPEGSMWFGSELQLADDVDGDGTRDMLVAAGASDAAYIVSPVTGDILTTFTNPLAGEWFFGWSIAFVGDVNADGLGDVAVGAMSREEGVSGAVHVFSGTGSLLETVRAPSPGDSSFGFGLAAVADIDGDAALELAIADNRGVQVVSGAMPSVTHYSMVTRGGYFGERMTAVADADCDGISDLAIAARDCATSGSVFVYSAVSGALLASLAPSELHAGARFGRSLAALTAPDAGTDGELLVGATGQDANRGAVFTLRLDTQCDSGKR